MSQNHLPVLRWKQRLLLPTLAGLFLFVVRPVQAQSMPGKDATDAERQAWKQLMNAKFRKAQHDDSLATGGKIPEGKVQVFQQRSSDGAVTITYQDKAKWEAEHQGQNDQKPGVYTYVEHMPELPSGGGITAIVQEIQKNLTYPAGENATGRVFVSFIVGTDGTVSDAKAFVPNGTNKDAYKSPGAAYEAAAVAAVNKLPRLTPGRQGGRAVPVSYTVPVRFAN